MTFATPVRVVRKLRPSVAPGLLFGSAAISTVFVATSFAVPEVIETYGIGPGRAALISTAQVGGFTLTNLVGGRRLDPSSGLARASLVAMVGVNVVSALTPGFSMLVALRFLSGLAMGLFTWIAWADSAADDTRRGEIASIAPLTSAIAAPMIAVAVNVGGLDGIYATLAVFCALCLALPMRVEAVITTGRRPIESKGVLPVLIGMGALTFGGSAVFVFAGVMARENVGMSDFSLSLALSVNALTGIPTARYAGRRRYPGVFIMITGVCAVLLAMASTVGVYFAVMAVWGVAYWAAVPETYALLSDRSRNAADRIGDAQAIMALGRVIGPTFGGVLVATGSFTVLGLVAGGAIILGGLAVEFVAMSHRWNGAASPPSW